MTNESTPDSGARRRFSRRRLLGTGGGGLAASAVIYGIGVRPGEASAAPVGPGPVRSAQWEANLRPSDPHAFTGRTRGQRALVQATPQIRVLPIDRAKFLAGARFDLRVEATGVEPGSARIDISLVGPQGPAALLAQEAQRAAADTQSLVVTYHDFIYTQPGAYTVRARVTSNGQEAETEVTHNVVVANPGSTTAKNVIFFLGDGMGTPSITAARILSKGISEGKYHGLLEMDQMEYRGLVGTSGVDSIVTDSANSMSAYMTGHKSSVNAMGVYEANEEDPNRHPWVENITELLKRTRDMSIGVVTTSEIQDATPAAVWAHTRRRSEYIDIMDQALEPGQRPDVLMGGGLHALLPQSEEGSRREDDRDLREEFQDLGYAYVTNRAELNRVVAGGPPERLLGTFHLGNMNVYLDRQHLPNPRVLGPWTDQPNLMETTAAAIEVLEQNPNGFFLMIEAASIDKMEHPLDGPRAVYDTIELDQAIGVARQWAEGRDDTLIVITADHNHSLSIVGTHDKRVDTQPDDRRQANGVYGDAGFPTYVDSDGDGFPDDPDPDVRLFYGWSNHPDHTDEFRHQPVFLQPALIDPDTGRAVDNPARDPDALEQIGNLPYNQTNCVHTVEDVSVFASGPGAARFNGFLDNTEVFFGMMDALALDVLGEQAEEEDLERLSRRREPGRGEGVAAGVG